MHVHIFRFFFTESVEKVIDDTLKIVGSFQSAAPKAVDVTEIDAWINVRGKFAKFDDFSYRTDLRLFSHSFGTNNQVIVAVLFYSVESARKIVTCACKRFVSRLFALCPRVKNASLTVKMSECFERTCEVIYRIVRFFLFNGSKINEIRRVNADFDAEFVGFVPYCFCGSFAYANAFAEDREKAIAAGMTDFVAKPVNFATLLAAIRTATSR